MAAVAASLFVALSALVIGGAADTFDNDVRLAIYEWSAPWRDWLPPLVRFASEAGSVTVLLVLGAMAALVAYLLDRRRIGFSLALTLVATMLVNTGLKLIFARVRPEPFYGDFLDTYSFPSGHSAYACCFYVSAAAIAAGYARNSVQRVCIFGAAILLVAVIGFSRVYLGVHYPTDVMGGWLVAITSVAIARVIDSGRVAD